MSSGHILIVEDERKIASLLRDYLEKQHYQVSHLSQGDEVVFFVKKEAPDLILLDIMIPGQDGMSVCRELRTFTSVPVIMITARVEEVDRLLGFEFGADDYICKPFSPREVLARIKAVLRRANMQTASNISALGPIKLNVDTHQVWVHDNEIKLTPSEFKILRILIGHPNKVFSRAVLIEQVQGYDFDGYDRTIDSHIKNIRKKITTAGGKDVICSIYGEGYKIIT